MSMPKPFMRLVLRWFICSLGLYIAANLLSSHIQYKGTYVIIVAGLVLAIINSIIKPILVVLSLPAIILSLGLFMILINGITVYIASRLYPQLHINNFLAAIFAGMVIGLVNYLVESIIERKK